MNKCASRQLETWNRKLEVGVRRKGSVSVKYFTDAHKERFAIKCCPMVGILAMFRCAKERRRSRDDHTTETLYDYKERGGVDGGRKVLFEVTGTTDEVYTGTTGGILKGWIPRRCFYICVCVFFFFSRQRAFDEVLRGGFVPDVGVGVPHGDRGAGGPRPALQSAAAADVRRACQAGDIKYSRRSKYFRGKHTSFPAVLDGKASTIG